MKSFKLFFASLLMVSFSFVAGAQEISEAFKVSGNCGMCKNKIETYLKRHDGINYINVNVKGKVTTVKYITDRINEEEIKTAIANAGYDAAEIEANPDSYKRLPKCCKKPEDGGGMKKE